nr:uncharacterized protein LOC109173369 [Ipomoea batatas]
MECVTEKESKPRILTGILSFTIIIDNSSISMTNEDKYGATLEVLKDLLFVFLDDEMDINYGVVV